METSDEHGRHPLLAYHSGLEDPRPPSFADVLAGLWWSLLALCGLSLGLLCLAWAAMPLLPGNADRASGPASLLVPGVVALISLPASLGLFRLAWRCFAAKPRPDLPQAFTRRSSMALRMAVAEASSRRSTLEAGHVLLGILEAAPNSAVAVLKHVNVDVQSLQETLERALGPRQRPVAGAMVQPPPEPSRFLHVLRRAIEESEQQQLLYVGTEHLLLALLAEPPMPAMLGGLDAERLAVEIELLRPILPNEAVEEPGEEDA